MNVLPPSSSQKIECGGITFFRNVKKFTPDYAVHIAEDVDLSMDYSQRDDLHRRVGGSGAVREVLAISGCTVLLLVPTTGSFAATRRLKTSTILGIVY
jgi:hypothetical protein